VPPVTITAAAHTLGIAGATLRRWIREDGCPCVSPGSAGRGHGAMVDPDAVKRWRAGGAGEAVAQGRETDVLERVAGALWDTLSRDGGEGVPVHRTLGIGRAQAAALLAIAYDRIARGVTGHDAERLPPQIELLRTVCVRSVNSNIGDKST